MANRSRPNPAVYQASQAAPAMTAARGQRPLEPHRSAPAFVNRHGVCHEIRVSCTGSGPIRGRGEQRRRRGGARSRASTSDSRPVSERSVPAGREVSWPCAPAPSSATESARRADRDTGDGAGAGRPNLVRDFVPDTLRTHPVPAHRRCVNVRRPRSAGRARSAFPGTVPAVHRTGSVARSPAIRRPPGS